MRLSCCSFAANAVRLQLHALACNLTNFTRTLALPEAVAEASATSRDISYIVKTNDSFSTDE